MKTAKEHITVLLLSAPIGSGHRLAAEALKQAFAKKNVTVIHGNVFDFFPAFLGNLFLKSYLFILRLCPVLYKFVYQWGNRQSGSLLMRNLINSILAKLGSSYIDRVKPDAVIATHATPAGIMSIYKRRHKDLYLCGVITDYTVHKWWLCDGVDTYFIADDLLKERITVKADVQAFGIPVREEFQNLDVMELRRELGWKRIDIVCLLAGGGEGLLPMDEIIAAVNEDKSIGIKFIAAVGHNKNLQERLQHFSNTEVYTFTDKLPQLMAAADIIVSKAGGLSSAEILALRKKFIIYKPLPGQEEGNADFLRKNYGVIVADDISEIKQALMQQITDKNEEKTHASAIENEKVKAAEKICDYVLNKVLQN